MDIRTGHVPRTSNPSEPSLLRVCPDPRGVTKKKKKQVTDIQGKDSTSEEGKKVSLEPFPFDFPNHRDKLNVGVPWCTCTRTSGEGRQGHTGTKEKTEGRPSEYRPTRLGPKLKISTTKR